MTNSWGLRQTVIFMGVLMIYGLVLFSVAHYLNIDLMIPRETVVMQGFVSSRETDVSKISEIRSVESVESILKMEERK